MTHVAAIQMVSSADVGGNLEAARALLRQARDRGARIAALPENFAFMGLREADKLAIAEDEGEGPIQQAVSGLARELGLWIVAGTLPQHRVTKLSPRPASPDDLRQLFLGAMRYW
mgnify:CR=1 FL=1